MTLPDFLYIGTSRAGSTWLFQALDAHPQVYVPPAKDIMFFDRLYDRGLDWYAGFFPVDASGYGAIGELSHDYFQQALFAERIQASLPNVRMIACLREPGSQSLSAYRWWRNHGGFHGGYAAFTDTPLCLQALRYYDNLQPFFALFSRDQLHITFYDHLQQDPHSFLRTIYSFLNVDDTFLPATVEKRVNAIHQPRSPWVSRLAYTTVQVTRRLGLGNLVGKLKHNPHLSALLYQPASDDEELTPEDQAALAALRQQCRAWYPPLVELLQQPLPAGWWEQD